MLDYASQYPYRALWIYMGCSVVLWSVQCSLLQRILPLDVLETINWGAQWSWGHAKHPPLSGWLGYLFSLLSGHRDWSMYVLAQLCLVMGVYFTYKLAREFFDEPTSAASAMVLYIVDYYTPSPMKYCSHFVQSGVQPLMAWLFYLAVRDNRWHQWVLFGVVSALGVLGKYSAGMLLVALLCCMCCFPSARSRFFSYGPYVSLLVFFLVLSPHLYWLWQNDFTCIRHLDARVETVHHSFWYGFQVLAVSLYPYLLELAVLILARIQRADWRSAFKLEVNWKREPFVWSLLMCWIPSLMLVAIGFKGDSVVLMWFSSMISWSGILCVSLLGGSVDSRSFGRLWLLIVAYTLAVFAVTTVDLLIHPREKLHTEPQVLVKLAGDFWKENYSGEVPALVGYRWLANAVENYAPHRPPSADLHDAVSIQRLEPIMNARGVLLIGDNKREYADFLKQYYPGIKGHGTVRSFTYRAWFGPEKRDDVFMMALPPRQTAIKK